MTRARRPAALGAGLALALLTGCTSYDPALLPPLEAIDALEGASGAAGLGAHRVVVMLPEAPPPPVTAPEDVRRGPMRFDPRALQQEIEAALARLAPPGAVRVAASEDELGEAWEAGHDIVLRPRVLRWDAAFLGTNGWWIPNAFFFAWYFFPIGPQWLLADEVYGVDVELELSAELASSGRALPTLRGERIAVASTLDAEEADLAAFERSPPPFALTDMQRGIDLFGTYFPGDLDPDQWEAVGELLGPFARRHAALRIAAEAARAVRAYDELPPDQRRATAATVHALVIGVEDAGAEPRVAGAGADAARVAQALVRAGAPGRNVVTLLNANATRAAVLEALARVVARCGPEDTLVVAFAGAGLRQQDEQGALASYSLVLPRGGLSLDELLRALRARPAFRRLVLLDADFEHGPRGKTPESFPPAPRPLAAVLAAELGREDVVVLASRGGSESVQTCEDEAGEPLGLLSLYAARALAGEADTGRDGLTIGDLEAWLDERVPHVALTLPRPQQPQVVVSGALGSRRGDLLRR